MKTYKNYKTLVIGCGIKKIKGAWNTDILNSTNPDEIVDIAWGLPYKDNSFKEVIAEYVLCQIHDNEKFKFSMNEMYRVLKPNGILKIRVPNAKFPETAFRDPADNRWFVEETFTHFDYKHYRYQKLSKNEGFLPWKILKIEKIGGGTTPEIKDRLYVEMSPYKNKN